MDADKEGDLEEADSPKPGSSDRMKRKDAIEKADDDDGQ